MISLADGGLSVRPGDSVVSDNERMDTMLESEGGRKLACAPVAPRTTMIFLLVSAILGKEFAWITLKNNV